ncbi:MAG: LysM peptidoglycan-binding domain-containing protein [Lachnospiraceae bacterium]|nr:LysM peptidoglycan-binding domain-containing protein [Lachnospiraceae bacterium]
MRQSSIIIHKGGKEEKYEIYVEDYVLSFLKEETGTLELSEFFFYGFKEKFGRKYTIYGAGRDRHLEVFDKYSLLEEIGCRLTQAGPVFLVREGTENYEVKGYEVFYQDNAPMQTYLIERKNGNGGKDRDSDPVEADRSSRTDQRKWQSAQPQAVQGQTPRRQISPSTISAQLSIILMILVAIVVNSTNSYDEMQQLNQSATEVFFAMENQSAEKTSEAGDGRGEVVVQREPSQEEDILKLAALENKEQAGEPEEAAGEEKSEETEEKSLDENDKNTAEPSGDSQDDVGNDNAEADRRNDGEEIGESETSEENSDQTEEEVEALSRNVARYYKVEPGDTLYMISQKIYGDTSHVQRICELNQITDPDRIRDGQKIILP